MRPPLVAILAGGEGRRIGGGKPQRPLGGRTLLDRAVDSARRWSGDVRIVVRSAGQLARPPLPLILDDASIEGPLGGLASALRAAEATGTQTLLTVPCDAPFLPEDLHARLAGALPGHGAAVAASGGRLHPVCALWRVRTAAALARYAEAGGRSLRGFADAVGCAAVEWPDEVFFNVNSGADLAEAERRLRS